MRAYSYTRLSSADTLPDGTLDPEAVERQARAVEAYCQRQGWTIVARGVDNDFSASDYARKARPAWTEVLAAMRAGTVDVVVGPHLDRLTRSMTELEHLIRLVERTGVGVAAVDGSLDLTTDNGKAVARMGVVFAAHASDATSRRVRAQRRDRAQQGKPYRSRDGFGWRDGVPVEAEAEAIVVAARAVLAGAPLEAIARDWTAQGLQRRGTAAPWRGVNVRAALLNPRNRGRAVYRGEDVGPLTDGTPVLLPPEIADPLLAVLNAPGRGVGQPRRRAMLTSLVRCGRCGKTMVRSTASKGQRRVWACKSARGGCGGVSIAAKGLEAAVGAAVLAALGEPRKAAPADPANAEVYAELRELEEREATLSAGFATGKVPMKMLVATTRHIEARRAELLATLAPSRRDAALARFGSVEALRAQWDTLESAEQNAVVSAVVAAVEVAPATPTLRGLDRAKIVWLA